MVMLIAGGSLSAGSHNPHLGTSMPLGAVHPISGGATPSDGSAIASGAFVALVVRHGTGATSPFAQHKRCRMKIAIVVPWL